jgi:hypothetical protein
MLPQQRGQRLPTVTFFFVTAIWRSRHAKPCTDRRPKGMQCVLPRKGRKQTTLGVQCQTIAQDKSTQETLHEEAEGGGGVSRSRGRGGGGWGVADGEALVPPPPPPPWLCAQQRPRRWQGGRTRCCRLAIRALSWCAKGCIKAILRRY